MKLLFTTNEMVNIFNRNMKFVVLQKTLLEIKNELIKEEISKKLDAFNIIYKALKVICNDFSDTEWC